MITPENIRNLVNIHLDPILSGAELAITSERQFRLFRKIVLQEFGTEGFQKNLNVLFEKEKATEKEQE